MQTSSFTQLHNKLDTQSAHLGHGYVWIQASETSTGPDAGPRRLGKDHPALQAKIQRELRDCADCGLQRGDAGYRQEQPRTDGVGCGGPEENEAPLEALLLRHSWTDVCGWQLGWEATGWGPQGTSSGNSITEFDSCEKHQVRLPPPLSLSRLKRNKETECLFAFNIIFCLLRCTVCVTFTPDLRFCRLGKGVYTDKLKGRRGFLPINMRH